MYNVHTYENSMFSYFALTKHAHKWHGCSVFSLVCWKENMFLRVIYNKKEKTVTKNIFLELKNDRLPTCYFVLGFSGESWRGCFLSCIRPIWAFWLYSIHILYSSLPPVPWRHRRIRPPNSIDFLPGKRKNVTVVLVTILSMWMGSGVDKRLACRYFKGSQITILKFLIFL